MRSPRHNCQSAPACETCDHPIDESAVLAKVASRRRSCFFSARGLSGDSSCLPGLITPTLTLPHKGGGDKSGTSFRQETLQTLKDNRRLTPPSRPFVLFFVLFILVF